MDEENKTAMEEQEDDYSWDGAIEFEDGTMLDDPEVQEHIQRVVAETMAEENHQVSLEEYDMVKDRADTIFETPKNDEAVTDLPAAAFIPIAQFDTEVTKEKPLPIPEIKVASEEVALQSEVMETVGDALSRVDELREEASKYRDIGEHEVADLVDVNASVTMKLTEESLDKIEAALETPEYQSDRSVGMRIREALITLDRSRLVLEQKFRDFPERSHELKNDVKEEVQKIGTKQSIREEAQSRVAAWNTQRSEAKLDQKELSFEKTYDRDLGAHTKDLMRNIERAYKVSAKAHGYSALENHSITRSFNSSVDTMTRLKKQIDDEVKRREKMRDNGKMINPKGLVMLKQLQYNLTGIEAQLTYDAKRWNMAFKGQER